MNLLNTEHLWSNQDSFLDIPPQELQARDYELENDLFEFFYKSLIHKDNLLKGDQLSSIINLYEEREQYLEHCNHQITRKVIQKIKQTLPERAMIDSQGLMWPSEGLRNKVLSQRSNLFHSYTHLPDSHRLANLTVDFKLQPHSGHYDSKFMQIQPLFEFHKFFTLPKPDVTHFQLRHLVYCVDKNSVFYIENGPESSRIMRLDPETNKIYTQLDLVNSQFADLKISTISANRSLISIGSFNGTLLTYDLHTNRFQEYLLTNQLDGIITYILMSRHRSFANQLMISSNDKFLRSFDYTTNQVIKADKLDFAINTICEGPVSEQSQVLISGDTQNSFIIDRRLPKLSALPIILTGHYDYTFASDWNINHLIATGNQDGTVRIYDTRYLSNTTKNPSGNSTLFTFSGKLNGAIRNLKFDDTGNYLAFAESIDNVYLIDLKSGGLENIDPGLMCPPTPPSSRIPLQYQPISCIGKITGLSFIPSENNTQVLTIGITDFSSGGILQYKIDNYVDPQIAAFI